MESTNTDKGIRLKDKRMKQGGGEGIEGVEPEEVPFHCALSLCHRLDSLKQNFVNSLG